MTLQLWLVYATAVTALALTPGPNSLLALTHGGQFGARRAAVTALGSVTGFGVLIALSMVGLGALFATSTQVFDVVRWIGALYLVYLGIRIWRSDPVHVASGIGSRPAVPRRRKLFSTGFLVAMSNPKVILFYGAFLPQFMDTQAPLFPQFVILAATFMVVEWIVEVGIAAGATRIAPWLGQSVNARLFNRVTGGVFVFAGVALAASDR